MMSAGNLFGGLLFSMIGMGAFLYGRKNGEGRPILIGIALMTYPYFVSGIWLYAVGVILTSLIFLFRDS